MSFTTLGKFQLSSLLKRFLFYLLSSHPWMPVTYYYCFLCFSCSSFSLCFTLDIFYWLCLSAVLSCRTFNLLLKSPIQRLYISVQQCFLYSWVWTPIACANSTFFLLFLFSPIFLNILIQLILKSLSGNSNIGLLAGLLLGRGPMALSLHIPSNFFIECHILG